MDWKEHIGNYLASKEIYRLEYLNNQLAVYCKEWADYIREFDRFKTYHGKESVPISETNSVIDKYVSFIIVSRHREYPFKVSCAYESNLLLKIRYTKGIDFHNIQQDSIGIEDSFRKLQDKYECKYYQWVEDFHEGTEIHAKEYLFQVFNNLLIQWINLNVKV